MPEDDDRNGHGPMGDEPPPARFGRRPPLQVAPPAAGSPPRDRERAVADALFAVSHRVNEIDSDVIDVKVAVIGIDARLDRIEGRLHPHVDLSAYNPDLTPAGGIRVEPVAWAALQKRIAELDRERELAAARAQGAEDALAEKEEKQKKRREKLLVWGTVLAPFVAAALTGVGVLIAHVLHW